MCKNNHHMNKKFRCLLVSLIFTAMWNGATIQAQAPHPERIYLSGTGIDDTKTWDFFCSAGQNSGKWKKIEVPCNWELQGFGEYTYGRWYTIKGQRPVMKPEFTAINLTPPNHAQGNG